MITRYSLFYRFSWSPTLPKHRGVRNWPGYWPCSSFLGVLGYFISCWPHWRNADYSIDNFTTISFTAMIDFSISELNYNMHKILASVILWYQLSSKTYYVSCSLNQLSDFLWFLSNKSLYIKVLIHDLNTSTNWSTPQPFVVLINSKTPLIVNVLS